MYIYIFPVVAIWLQWITCRLRLWKKRCSQTYSASIWANVFKQSLTRLVHLYLKLVQTRINYCLTTLPLQISFSSYTYYLGWMSCVISFAWALIELRGMGSKGRLQNEKFLSTVGFEPTTITKRTFYQQDQSWLVGNESVLPLKMYVLRTV